MKTCLTAIIIIVQMTISLNANPLTEHSMSSYRGTSFYGYAPDKIVITFSKEVIDRFDAHALVQGRTGIDEIDRIGERFQAKLIRRLFPDFTPRSINGRPIELSLYYQVFFAQDVDLDLVLAAYRKLSGVIKAEAVGIHYVTALPNDAQFNLQWHLQQANDVDVDAPEAWDIETGDASIIVAVMDTGVRYYHKDLGGSAAAFNDFSNIDGNMWINWSEKNGVANVDDDSNGYVDDWIGYDFVDNAPTTGINRVDPAEDGDVIDNDPRDFHGHGTHCAGNVGALNNNGYALCSVSGGWGDGTFQPAGNGVQVMALRNGYALRFFGGGVVQMDAAAQCFVYAAENGARIASCSWGSSNSGGLGAAIDQFVAAGGLVFHAAGNDNADDPDYIDLRGDCISVAATDQNDNAASFTNYGTWVDVSAPGVDIVSTGHNHDDDANDYYATMSGTSMSTPIAASVAALIWSRHPAWSAQQVKEQLLATVDNIENSLDAAHKGKMGAGRVNAYNAVNDEPIAVKLSSFETAPQEDGSTLISWQTHSESDIAGFFVQKSQSAGHPFQRLHTHMIAAKGDDASGAHYSFIEQESKSQRCFYRLELCELDGQSSFSASIEISPSSVVPASTLALHANYPNPFNPITTISYDMADDASVQLEIFDASGRRVCVLVNATQTVGRYNLSWNGLDAFGDPVASGIYIARLTSNGACRTQKMILAR
ncbi:MAG: T9SS C-terminal target domain-containing protein [Calditrichaeota bacterium]|nr:MAG: T9SS C-terminal target domain-containing protein [Calditrichota bacterium]